MNVKNTQFICQINPGEALVFQHPFSSRHNCNTSTCTDPISLLQFDNFIQNNLRKKKRVHAHILPFQLPSVFVRIAARKVTLISIRSFLLCLYPNCEHSKVTQITKTPTFLCITQNSNTHQNFLALMSLLSCNNSQICLKIKVSLSDPQINYIYIPYVLLLFHSLHFSYTFMSV